MIMSARQGIAKNAHIKVKTRFFTVIVSSGFAIAYYVNIKVMILQGNLLEFQRFYLVFAEEFEDGGRRADGEGRVGAGGRDPG